MQLVEQIIPAEHKTDFKTTYIKYRAGRLKHQYWLWNRKSQNKIVDEYDACILKNCQAGKTAFFASAGYYLKDIWSDIDSIEMHPVVSEFYSDIIFTESRQELPQVVPYHYDNFAVVNNRGDHWVDVDGLTGHIQNYSTVMNPGCRFFYSFRDTQIHVNRLTTDLEKHFFDWAQGLSQIGFNLVWHSIDFAKKLPDQNGYYDQLENPDTTNGNLKFWFVYKGTSWTPTF
jgi:hypothetical protein